MRTKASYKSPVWGEYLPSYFLSKSDFNPTAIGWVEVLRLYREDDRIKELTLKAQDYLRAGQEASYNAVKYKMPAIAFAGQFEGGHKIDNLKGLTGVGFCDLDHVPINQMADILKAVRADRHTLMCHTTASGEGIRILYPYTCSAPEVAYRDAWALGNRHFYIMKLACLLVKMGVPQNEAAQHAATLMPDDTVDAEKAVAWVYDKCASNFGEWAQPRPANTASARPLSRGGKKLRWSFDSVSRREFARQAQAIGQKR